MIRVQRDKENLVLDSGRATDHLAAISRQLADTVQVQHFCHTLITFFDFGLNKTQEILCAVNGVNYLLDSF